MRATLASLLVVTLVCSSGCSFTFTETVPDRYETLPYFDCTSTMGLPVADGFIAASSALSGITALTKSKTEFADANDDANRDLFAGVSIGMAVVMASSAIFGLVHANECIDAKAQLKARLMPPVSSTRKVIAPAQPVEPPVVLPQPVEVPQPQVQPQAPVPPPAADAPQPSAAPQAAPPAR